MLEHFIRPVSAEIIDAAKNGNTNIASYISSSLTKNTQNRCAGIVGANERFVTGIRLPFYRLAHRLKQTELVDLGDFRNTNPEFMAAPIETLVEQGVLPIIFSSTVQDAGQLIGLLSKRDSSTWASAAIIHEATALQFPDTSLSTCYVGGQSHLMTDELHKTLNEQHAQHVRLSQVRDNFSDIEPSLRDADCIVFDLSAMRSSDLPGQSGRSSSGFFTEEACKILRYAGMSCRLKCIIFTGAAAAHPRDFQSSNTTAQLLWYFLSGYDESVDESPTDNTERFTRYIVALQGYDFDVTFFKSEQTERWWFAVSDDEVVSCSYHDYLSACDNVITERVLNGISRSMKVVD